MELIIRRQRPLQTAAAWLRKQKLCYLCYLLFNRPRNLKHPVHEPASTKTGGEFEQEEREETEVPARLGVFNAQAW